MSRGTVVLPARERAPTVRAPKAHQENALATRKSEASPVPPELLQTLAEALRAASQAQQTMAEAMLALASRSEASGTVTPKTGARSAPDGGIAYPHVGTIEWVDEGLTFVEAVPGEFRASFEELALSDKRVRIELNLSQLLSDELRAQSSGFFSGLANFVSQQKDYKIVSDAQCEDN